MKELIGLISNKLAENNVELIQPLRFEIDHETWIHFQQTLDVENRYRISPIDTSGWSMDMSYRTYLREYKFVISCEAAHSASRIRHLKRSITELQSELTLLQGETNANL